ncbi:hypothetical protein DZC30_07015 [Comamonas testosteroni]|uniref:MORN repeat protein n=1 Tax=Comamonas testosteroni TaxID=285 RepID=A0A373FNH1_COMTE|nr:hypothetical protein DZC30_07015 [Comamonas testosteroni]
MLVLCLSLFAIAAPTAAHSQVNPEIANCSELKDEATITQADLCSAHIGCRFVLGVQKTCARAKSYLERLRTAIGEGTPTLFGLLGNRKEVTPDAVFTAALGADNMEQQRKLGGNTKFQQQAQDVSARVREVGNGSTLTGRSPSGTDWIYYGQTSGGKANGTGSFIYSSGEIQRGQFKNDDLDGPGDVLFASGTRFVGTINEDSGRREGLQVDEAGFQRDGVRYSDGKFIGVMTRPDGSKFRGTIDKTMLKEGREYRPDGTLAEEGRYEGGKLFVGTRYDAAGVATAVNLPAEREAAKRAAAAAEQQRKQDEEQRQREAAAQAEQQFRASLQAMNPGQLFAKADELNAQGERNRSREVLRTLVSRFPDHALAATAARQLSGETGASPAPSGASAAGAAPRSPGGALSAKACSDMKQAVISTRIPANASVTTSMETVMFMTKTALDMIAGNCPTEGATPAQIEAERQERTRQYKAAEDACNAVQSGGRRCVAQRH